MYNAGYYTAKDNTRAYMNRLHEIRDRQYGNGKSDEVKRTEDRNQRIRERHI